MDLTLLRHAALPLAYHGRYIGHTDIGIDPALFDAEKASRLTDKQYDRIYCSDLARCTETLAQMGIERYIADPRLREVRFKPSFEGKNFAEIEATDGYDPLFLDSRESWHRYICDEPMDLFRHRIENFLKELPENETVLICTHGGTIAMILSLLEPERSMPPCDYLDHISLTIPIG